jgi:uncharacterized small protein (DUF1192 family)
MRRRVNPEFELAKRQVTKLENRIAYLEQELEWMTGERNKLHRIVQAAREGHERIHRALFPDSVYQLYQEPAG